MKTLLLLALAAALWLITGFDAGGWAAEYDPQPAVDAATAMAQPQLAVAAVAKQSQALVAAAQAPWWQSAWAVTSGVLLTILGAARFLPGVYGGIASVAHALLEPRSKRRAREYQETSSQGMQELVRVIEGLPNSGTIGELKRRIGNKVPAPIKDAINAYVRTLEHEPPRIQDLEIATVDMEPTGRPADRSSHRTAVKTTEITARPGSPSLN